MRDAKRKVKRSAGRRLGGIQRLRYYAEYAGLRVATLGIRTLPMEAGAAGMAFAWRLFGPLSARHRRALVNLAIAFPELDEAARRQIARSQWDNLGRTSAETLQIDRFLADPGRIELAISPALEARLNEPGGKIMVSMHSANWEIAALPMRRFRSVAGLYQRIKNPLVDDFVRRLRTQVYDGGLYSKGAATAGKITRWVRGGNAMAMLADSREGRGVEVTVFGRRTRANPFPAMLARRLGVPLIAGRVIRLPGSQFRVEAAEIPVPVTDDSKADVQCATQRAQEQFEAWIRERPGEWMWVQNRWRGDPALDGSREASAPASCQSEPNGPISRR